jgi:hypothetical protein
MIQALQLLSRHSARQQHICIMLEIVCMRGKICRQKQHKHFMRGAESFIFTLCRAIARKREREALQRGFHNIFLSLMSECALCETGIVDLIDSSSLPSPLLPRNMPLLILLALLLPSFLHLIRLGKRVIAMWFVCVLLFPIPCTRAVMLFGSRS